jgi:hypothetical protein
MTSGSIPGSSRLASLAVDWTDLESYSAPAAKGGEYARPRGLLGARKSNLLRGGDAVLQLLPVGGIMMPDEQTTVPS